MLNNIMKVDDDFVEGYCKINPSIDFNISLKPKTKKMSFELWNTIKLFLIYIYEKEKTEALVRLFYNRETMEWSAHCYPQEVGSAHTDDEYQEGSLSPGWFPWGTVHSHPGAAFSSGVDDKDEFNQDGIHITLGKLDTKDGFIDLHHRFIYAGHTYKTNLHDWINCPYDVSWLPSSLSEIPFLKHENSNAEKLPKEWIDNVKKKTTKLPSNTGTCTPVTVKNTNAKTGLQTNSFHSKISDSLHLDAATFNANEMLYWYPSNVAQFQLGKEINKEISFIENSLANGKDALKTINLIKKFSDSTCIKFDNIIECLLNYSTEEICDPSEEAFIYFIENHIYVEDISMVFRNPSQVSRLLSPDWSEFKVPYKYSIAKEIDEAAERSELTRKQVIDLIIDPASGMFDGNGLLPQGLFSKDFTDYLEAINCNYNKIEFDYKY